MPGTRSRSRAGGTAALPADTTVFGRALEGLRAVTVRAELVLDRPKALNSLDLSMCRALHTALDEASKDEHTVALTVPPLEGVTYKVKFQAEKVGATSLLLPKPR